MQEDRIKEFSLRISQANKTELVVISYDIVLEDISEAREAYRAGDIENYRLNIKYATQIMNEIMGSLDYSQKLSYELISLYKYVNKELVRAMMSKTADVLDSPEEVLKGLRKAFSEVAKLDKSPTIMRNTQTIAAGTTYGRNAMDTVCINVESMSRGFMA